MYFWCKYVAFWTTNIYGFFQDILPNITNTSRKLFQKENLFRSSGESLGRMLQVSTRYLVSEAQKAEHQVARATWCSAFWSLILAGTQTFFMNLLHVATLMHRILGWRLHFWKILKLQVLGACIFKDYFPSVFRILRIIIQNGSV